MSKRHVSTRSFHYTPAANFDGIDSFTYRVSDGAAFGPAVTVSIDVLTVNDAPQSISLTETSVFEQTPGAVVGAIVVSDPDAGDEFDFQVDDDRFEVVAGQLKLKDGIRLLARAEPVVTLQLTASDSGTPPQELTGAVTLSVKRIASWHNLALPPDVDDDGVVDLGDLLTLVAKLRQTNPLQLGAPPDPESLDALFVDVDSDGWLTVRDLLAVVDAVRARISDLP